jgi:hypothetical protein
MQQKASTQLNFVVIYSDGGGGCSLMHHRHSSRQIATLFVLSKQKLSCQLKIFA